MCRVAEPLAASSAGMWQGITDMATSTDAASGDKAIHRLLAGIRREARWWIWVESLAMLAVAASVAILATLAIDWLIEPPAWARATLVVIAACGLMWIVATRLVVRLCTPLADRSLALAVERMHPELGDTLSTAVGLAAETSPEVDPVLVERTAAAARALAAKVSPRRIFRRGQLGMVAAAGIALTSTIAGFAVARPDVGSLWTRRMLLLDDAAWPRRVQFQAIGFRDNAMTVARGTDVEVLTRATVTSGAVPELVELRMRGRDGTLAARMGTRGGADATGQLFAHVLEGVSDDLDLEIRGGDGRLRDLRLVVVDPPTLAGVTIQYELPAYLGGGERKPPFSRIVPVPRGSKVSVAFTASKPMTTARLTARFATARAADEQADVLLAEVSATEPPGTVIAATIPALDADAILAVHLTDADGISPSDPFTLALAAVPDEPPTVALRLADIAGAVTPAARLPFVGTLADDHGLARATVSVVRGDDAWSQPVERIRGGEPLVEFTTDEPEIMPLAGLSLRPGDRLAVRVTARDTCGLAGGPNESDGETWTLDVVTPEALQAALEAREIFLRRRLEAAIDDLGMARRGLDDPQPQATEAFKAAAGRLGEAASRAVGEVGEIATAFRGIRNEFAANGLLTAELESRLVGQVAEPLAAVTASGLGGLADACRSAGAGETDRPALAARADAAMTALKAILARLLELESFNEVVEKLRSLIRTQEQIRADTLEQQRKRAREALEGL